MPQHQLSRDRRQMKTMALVRTCWKSWDILDSLGCLKMFNDFHYRRVMHLMPQGKPSSAPSILCSRCVWVSLQVSIVYVYSIQNQMADSWANHCEELHPSMSCNWCPSAEGFRVPGWNANLNLDRREGCKVDARARKEGRDQKSGCFGFPQFSRNTDLKRHDL